MNRWTLHIEEFGKIDRANVEVAPLTFLVGENNSGKSYIMTLIYGLLQIQLAFRSYDLCEDSEEYKNCLSFIEKQIESGMDNFVLRESELKLFENLLNLILETNAHKFIEELFNQEIEIGTLKISVSKNEEFQFKIRRMNNNERFIILQLYSSTKGAKPGYGIPEEELKKKKYAFFLCYILESLLKKDFVDLEEENVVYLPNARTGFLLTYKTIVGQAMQDKFNLQSQKKNLLTRPTGDFLNRLSTMTVDKKRKEFKEMIDFIEEEMLQGNINVSNMPSHDILYQPTGSEQNIPMYLSSGIVTELAPLVLLLKYCDIKTLIIEEPEIGLHPELQWKMAQLFIRLVNMGVPVIATTHSDLMIQHINNMLKLAKVRTNNQSVLDSEYNESDLLYDEQIAVYQFDTKENQQTVLQRLECKEYGFETMTFYNTLRNIGEQIDEIEKYMEDE